MSEVYPSSAALTDLTGVLVMHCGAELEGYVCTREKGHDGKHAAHGIDDFSPLRVWEEQ